MKKLIFIAMLIVITTVVVVSATNVISNDTEDFSINEHSIAEAVNEQPDNSDKIIKLVEFASEQLVNSEDIEYIINLANEGYSIDDIKGAIMFWIDTDEDVKLIKKLLDNMHTDSNVKLVYRLENAYNKMNGNKCGELTYEEGRKYLEEGYTLEELALANTLSRKGKSDIHKILKSKKENGNMNKEIKEIYSKSKRERYNFDGVTDTQLSQMNEKEFVSSIKLSRIKKKDVKSIIGNKKEGFTEELETEKVKKLKSAKEKTTKIKRGGEHK